MHRICSKNNYLIGLTMFFTCVVSAQQTYSPYSDQNYPTNVYWGDTHVHTNLSADTALGNKPYGPAQAYRFAKGEEVVAHNGLKAQLRQPLDFLVVADHATNLGIKLGLDSADPELLKTAWGKKAYAQWQSIQAISDKKKQAEEMLGDFYTNLILPVFGGVEGEKKEDQFTVDRWKSVGEVADYHNDPGKFTAFIGYEWSSMGAKVSLVKSEDSLADRFDILGNLHRVVVFKDSTEKTQKVLPLTAYDSADPEALWEFMQEYEDKTGGEVLAIPHNGNLSRGEMFAPVNFKGDVLTQAYAKIRSRWEPLYEVTQIKGDSETHPMLSPEDEFADFETFDSWSVDEALTLDQTLINTKQSEYARSALKLGLQQQAILGVNPFKFGMIGSTDTHTSLATADENNFWGKHIGVEPNPKRILGGQGTFKYGMYTASGYAAVWAHENTRAALFAALKRKEVYATTGPRMTVRFFGGWDYNTDDAFSSDFVKIGYSKGVPMGSDLTHGPKNKAPSFLIRAVKDPDGANLDRVQVIKGWRARDGELHEKIYDVVLSDGRRKNWRGNIESVGSTVDIKEASYTNTIGDTELAVVWQDPDFENNELAFYYVRVLEIPTPRWPAYDAKFFNIPTTDIPKEVAMTTQERSYTSPIWYCPPAKAGGE